MNKSKKNIQVVAGDGSNLEVSEVYDHLNAIKPNLKEKKKKIIIPEVKKKKK